MTVTPQTFTQRAHQALGNETLQQALARAKSGFVDKRRRAVTGLPEFEALRERAVQIKDHTLTHLDEYLERYEQNVVAAGGQVHWAHDAEEACRQIIDLCQTHGATTVTKGKSMVAEEIGLNQALLEAGIEPIETDLGEYILQLAHERPSHIIAPAVHKTRQQIAELFAHKHRRYGYRQKLSAIPDLVDEVRGILRERFLAADAGITGANFLIAETGASVLVTNEGNGDLTAALPPAHIVVAGIEKVIPTLADASVMLRLLARSATGQAMSAYTTVSFGPGRGLEQKQAYHVVLVDNGRSAMLGGEFKTMLRCIRCGACLNHCPVYNVIGGHAYDSVYPGPMGAVLTPLLAGLEYAGDLPNACTLNGRCQAVCPVKIPLPDLLRALRVQQFKQRSNGRRGRFALALWAYCARHPPLYHALSRMAIAILSRFGKAEGGFQTLPFAKAWTQSRDFPAPQGTPFLSQWKDKRRP